MRMPTKRRWTFPNSKAPLPDMLRQQLGQATPLIQHRLNRYLRNMIYRFCWCEPTNFRLNGG
jgi:hypothetical protein